LTNSETQLGTILVIEDEESIREVLSYNLQQAGFSVILAGDGEEGLSLARSGKADLVVLDLMLPKVSGLDVCRLLRRESSIPILMLTAKGEEIDRVLGLELGADDYVLKPFSPREIIARVKAILRRSENSVAAGDPGAGATGSDHEVLVSGYLKIDTSAHRVYRSDSGMEQEVDLTPTEYNLLLYLMVNENKAISREQLLNQVWGYDYVGDPRTVDVHVRHLREKTEKDPSKPRLIETVRGIGYRLAKGAE